MKKFAYPKQQRQDTALFPADVAYAAGEKLVALIENKYQGMLKITNRKTSFPIYISYAECVYVCMVNKSSSATMIFNKLKRASERIIARSENAIFYASSIIKGPWPPGEEAISQSAGDSCRYAADVIKGPWPPGEKAIAADAGLSFGYARDVIKGPWSPGEKAISTSGRYAFNYAKDVIKGPFPLGEVAIKAELFFAKRYEEWVLKPAGATWSV